MSSEVKESDIFAIMFCVENIEKDINAIEETLSRLSYSDAKTADILEDVKDSLGALSKTSDFLENYINEYKNEQAIARQMKPLVTGQKEIKTTLKKISVELGRIGVTVGTIYALLHGM